MRIEWTRRAAGNLDAVQAYIEADDPVAAARVALRILAAVQQLADHPELGRAGRVPGTRELVVAGLPYTVPYRVVGSVVQVLRVFHDRTRWPDTF